MPHVETTKPCACSAIIGLFSSSHSEASFRVRLLEKFLLVVTKMTSDGKSPDAERSQFEMQVLACLQSLKSDMQSMTDRLEKVEEATKEIDEPQALGASSSGSAQRASTNHVCSTPRDPPSKSWAERMDEEDPIEGLSMEIDDGAGDEHDAKGIRLFTVSDRTESFLRPLFAAPLPNSARRQLRERFGAPNLPFTASPHLDKVLKSMVPASAKTRDAELARLQALALDAVGPLARIVEDATNGQLTAEDNMDAVQTSLRLLGNLSAQCNRLRRTAVLKNLNPRIADMAEEDGLYREAGLGLFGEASAERQKSATRS